MTPTTQNYDDDGWRINGRKQRLIPHPVTHQDLPYQRVSTFARTLSDGSGLANWKAHRVLLGAQQPGAHALVQQALHSTETPWAVIEAIADEYGGAKDAAKRGTARHQIVAARLEGDQLHGFTAEQIAEVDRICDLIRGVGDVTGIEVDTVNDRWRVAGRADYIVRLPDGSNAVGDLKTGKTLKHAEHAIQLAAHSDAHYYDRATQTRTGPVAPVTRLFVIHAPQNGKAPKFVEYDVSAAFALADLAATARDTARAIGPITTGGAA